MLSFHHKTFLMSDFIIRSMEAQQVVVMQTEATLEEEKVKNEEYLAVMRKYQERVDEMEVKN